jgi:hypothetical protein
MDREELESRSKAELIDLVLQQHERIERLQTQVADLQAQLAQQSPRKNGDEQALAALAAAQAVPAGRIPLAFRLIVIGAIALACALAAIAFGFRPAARVSVGQARDFPPGSVTAMHLPAPTRSDPALPIFLVNDPAAGFLALHQRDPGSSCKVEWNEAAQRFEDPCSGSKYARSGDYLEGPAPRSLDRFPVVVTENGEVLVDVSALQAGPPR